MSTSSDEIFTVRAVSASLSALPTSPLWYTYRFSYTQIMKLQPRGDVMPKLGFRDPPTDPRGCSRGLQQKGGGGIVWFHWYFISFWEYWLTYVCKAFNLSKTPHLLYAQLCLQFCKKSYKRGGSPSEKMWLYVADACLFRGLLCVLQIYKKRSVVVDSALCHHPLSIQHPSVYRKHNNRL